MRIKVKIGGIPRLLRWLRKLDAKTAKKILRKALRAGASVLKKAAAKMIPVDSRTLRKSMGIRIHIKRRTGVVYAIVGPKTKQKKQTAKGMRWASKYAHLVEGGRRGFKQRERVIEYTTRGGRRVRYVRRARFIKAVAPRHYMKNATRQTRSAVKAAILAKAAEEIKKEKG